MSDTITLHPKHGVNPTLAICMWCGEETGEIALLGNKFKGEAPRHMIISPVPCDECEARWKEGVVLLLANKTKTDRFDIELQEGTFVDGTHWVISHAAADILRITSPINFISHEVAMRLGILDEKGEPCSPTTTRSTDGCGSAATSASAHTESVH